MGYIYIYIYRYVCIYIYIFISIYIYIYIYIYMGYMVCLYGVLICVNRRKFRSQTSDNLDRWNSRGGKSQRREEQKREDQRRERVRRKKMQVRERIGKSRKQYIFPMICGSGGSKIDR